MDLDKLRGKIAEKFGSQKAFSRAIGWHENKVSAVLTGKYILDVDEAARVAERLSLTSSEYLDIFLVKKSPNGDKAGEVL